MRPVGGGSISGTVEAPSEGLTVQEMLPPRKESGAMGGKNGARYRLSRRSMPCLWHQDQGLPWRSFKCFVDLAQSGLSQLVQLNLLSFESLGDSKQSLGATSIDIVERVWEMRCPPLP